MQDLIPFPDRALSHFVISIQAKRNEEPAPYLIRGNPGTKYNWIPAFAGMTELNVGRIPQRRRIGLFGHSNL